MIFKIVDIPCPMATWWLTTEESRNPEFMNSLKPIIRHYQRKGYATATFLSGDQDLEACTHRLMKHNYELHMAQSSLAPDKGCKALSICCDFYYNLLWSTFILSVAFLSAACYNVAVKKHKRSGQH